MTSLPGEALGGNHPEAAVFCGELQCYFEVWQFSLVDMLVYASCTSPNFRVLLYWAIMHKCGDAEDCTATLSLRLLKGTQNLLMRDLEPACTWQSRLGKGQDRVPLRVAKPAPDGVWRSLSTPAREHIRF
jgi:hypothetical protein